MHIKIVILHILDNKSDEISNPKFWPQLTDGYKFRGWNFKRSEPWLIANLPQKLQVAGQWASSQAAYLVSLHTLRYALQYLSPIVSIHLAAWSTRKRKVYTCTNHKFWNTIFSECKRVKTSLSNSFLNCPLFNSLKSKISFFWSGFRHNSGIPYAPYRFRVRIRIRVRITIRIRVRVRIRVKIRVKIRVRDHGRD